jgi:hypothetical protein
MLAEIEKEQQLRVDFAHGVGVLAALHEVPDAREHIGIDGAFGDEAFGAKVGLVESAMRTTRTEDAADRGFRGAQFTRASDDRRGFFLDVAEVRELLRQLDH